MTLPYCCPCCKAPVRELGDAYRCDPCDATYPVILGIPDFRIYPDPYISIADDHEKARRIADAGDFKSMIERYWAITPDTPSDMAKRFIEHSLQGEERGRHLISRAAATSSGIAIELGCRTGGVVGALADQFDHAVGIDIAFRWLVVARQRLKEAGRSAQFVCCCADALPFPKQSFDFVLAENVLEHTEAQQELVDEAHRALRPGGTFFTKTWNRISPAPEPHVHLFFVGWMPRKLARRYVAWRGRDVYDHVRLISLFGLRQLVRRSPFGRGRYRPHTFSEGQIDRLGGLGRALVRMTMALARWPGVRQLLLLFGPELEASCTRSPDAADRN